MNHSVQVVDPAGPIYPGLSRPGLLVHPVGLQTRAPVARDSLSMLHAL